MVKALIGTVILSAPKGARMVVAYGSENFRESKEVISTKKPACSQEMEQ